MNSRLEWAVPSEDAPLVVFDIDGTLCHTHPKTDFQNPYSVLRGCRPNPATIARLKALWASNTCHVAVLTARNRSLLGDVTRAQLTEWLGPEIEDTLYGTWDSNIGSLAGLGARGFWMAVKEHKTFHLTNHQATVYVGDTHHDMEAARDAGIPFMSVYQFSRGERIPGLQPPSRRVTESIEDRENRVLAESDERASSLGEGCTCTWAPWWGASVIETVEDDCPEHGGLS